MAGHGDPEFPMAFSWCAIIVNGYYGKAYSYITIMALWSSYIWYAKWSIAIMALFRMIYLRTLILETVGQ